MNVEKEDFIRTSYQVVGTPMISDTVLPLPQLNMSYSLTPQVQSQLLNERMTGVTYSSGAELVGTVTAGPREECLHPGRINTV